MGQLKNKAFGNNKNVKDSKILQFQPDLVSTTNVQVSISSLPIYMWLFTIWHSVHGAIAISGYILPYLHMLRCGRVTPPIELGGQLWQSRPGQDRARLVVVPIRLQLLFLRWAEHRGHPQTTWSVLGPSTNNVIPFSNIFTPPSPTSPLLKPLNYQMFPDIIPLIPWNMVTSFMDGPLSSKIIVKIVGVWQDEEGPDGKCFLEGVRHRHIFMWFEWMKIPGEAWRQLTPTPRLAARVAPRQLRHEYLEQLAVDLYHLFEPYLHTQGRPDSLLKVQKSKDCILRASISSVFAQNNLIILFHFQMHNSCL